MLKRIAPIRTGTQIEGPIGRFDLTQLRIMGENKMRSIRNLIVGVVCAMLLSTGVHAGTDLNEVGALLVFPTIVAVSEDDDSRDDDKFMMADVETFVTITNAGPDDVVLHVSYINGQAYQRNWVADSDAVWEPNPTYCYECDFQIPMSGNDTETLVITHGEFGTHIIAEDLYLDMSCPWPFGMLVVALEDEDGNTISDNVLLGEEVVVDYVAGMAFSIPAIPFQGSSNDGNREYDFDDTEYGKLPRIVAADFLAPDVQAGRDAWATLSLFTLGFERQFPPLVDCSVIGFDADEHPFSSSFQFGCWTLFDLYDISPEFYYPNLGLFNNDPHHPIGDTHGWLQLNCSVDDNPAAADGFEVDGGVHGAIIQMQAQNSTLPAGSGSAFGSAAMWGRLLYQSVTTGDDVTLILEGNAAGLN